MQAGRMMSATAPRITQSCAQWALSAGDSATVQTDGVFSATAATSADIVAGQLLNLASQGNISATAGDSIKMQASQRMDMQALNIAQHAVDWALHAEDATIETTTFSASVTTDATIFAGNTLTLSRQNTIMEQAGRMHSLTARLITQTSDQWMANTTATSTLSSDDAFYVAAGRLLHLSSVDRTDAVVGETFNLTAPVAEQASTTWTVHTTNTSVLWHFLCVGSFESQHCRANGTANVH